MTLARASTVVNCIHSSACQGVRRSSIALLQVVFESAIGSLAGGLQTSCLCRQLHSLPDCALQLSRALNTLPRQPYKDRDNDRLQPQVFTRETAAAAAAAAAAASRFLTHAAYWVQLLLQQLNANTTSHAKGPTTNISNFKSCADSLITASSTACPKPCLAAPAAHACKQLNMSKQLQAQPLQPRLLITQELKETQLSSSDAHNQGWLALTCRSSQQCW